MDLNELKTPADNTNDSENEGEKNTRSEKRVMCACHIAIIRWLKNLITAEKK